MRPQSLVLDDAALSITRGLARREDSSRQLFIARLPRRTPPVREARRPRSVNVAGVPPDRIP